MVIYSGAHLMIVAGDEGAMPLAILFDIAHDLTLGPSKLAVANFVVG
jgi:hypothetical protein